MADPLSITAAAVALTVTMIERTADIIKFCTGAAELKENLSGLKQELNSLQDIRSTVAGICRWPDFALVMSQYEKTVGVSVTADLQQELDGVNLSVQRLEKIYVSFVPEKGLEATWVKKAWKQRKLEKMYSQISQIRQ